MNKNNDFNSRQLAECPWCSKFSIAPPVMENMVVVYNCYRCEKPIVFFNNETHQMDEDLVNTNDPHLIEEYILNFLKKYGVELFNGIEEINDDEFYDEDEITKEDVVKMKNFLKNFRVPVEGDFT